MTTLPRHTVNLKRETAEKIERLRKEPEFAGKSMSYVLNYLLIKGLEVGESESTQTSARLNIGQQSAPPPA